MIIFSSIAPLVHSLGTIKAMVRPGMNFHHHNEINFFDLSIGKRKYIMIFNSQGREQHMGNNAGYIFSLI